MIVLTTHKLSCSVLTRVQLKDTILIYCKMVLYILQYYRVNIRNYLFCSLDDNCITTLLYVGIFTSLDLMSFLYELIYTATLCIWILV